MFTTLTFARDTSIRDTWLRVNETTNRFTQRVRRTIDYCEYLKTYEVHQDGYPHVHVLFLFRNLQYPSDNSRWLPADVFTKLKSAWTHGLSDHQSPTRSSGYSPLKYILKYVSKTSSSSHLWGLLLGNSTTISQPQENSLGYPIHPPKYAAYHTLLVPHEQKLLVTTLKTKRIKLISWSRGFVPLYLSTLNS